MAGTGKHRKPSILRRARDRLLLAWWRAAELSMRDIVIVMLLAAILRPVDLEEI